MQCLTCKHWQPGKTPEPMRKLQMAICRHGPRWEFLPPQSSCQRHSPAADKAVDARRAWLLTGATSAVRGGSEPDEPQQGSAR